MRETNLAQSVKRLFYALLCGIWLYCFFPPMGQLGLVHGYQTFIEVFAAISLFHMSRRWWVRGLGGLLVAYTYVAYYWRPIHHTKLHLNLVEMPKILYQDLGLLLHAHKLVDPLETFLFIWLTLAIDWLLSYSIQKPWLWMFYNLLGIGVLAGIDSNTKVHPNVSLVVLLVLWIFVLGLHQVQRVQRHAPKSVQAPKNSKLRLRLFSLPLFALVCVVLLVAAVIPKTGPQWPNPFSSIGSGGGSGSGRGVQTIGYQLNDSHLGGSFVHSDTEVLDVYSPYPTYLRGQTLSTYTGKGWTSARLTDASMQQESVGRTFSVSQYAFHNMPIDTFSQRIQLKTNGVSTADLLGGYAVNNVSFLPKTYQGYFTLDLVQGNIHAPKLHANDIYQLQTEMMRAPYIILGQIKTPYQQIEGAIPPQIRAVDLQLPAELPDRIHTLAEQIIAQQPNSTEYQVVTDLISYLQANYTYQTTNVPVPGKNVDYVDQFLFDSKVGYCNNFSSSLAVMLRTLGIPTRWVTGYTSGTQNFNYTGKTDNEYVISNNDAHSWVEVYFPNYGWIPFDPTPNFSLPFAAATSSELAQLGSGTTSNSTTPPAPVKRQPQTPQSSTDKSSSSGNGFWLALASGKWIATGVVLVIAILLAVFLLFRRKFQRYRIQRQWQVNPRDGLQRTYTVLLRILHRRYGYPISATLRDLWPVLSQHGVQEQEFQTWIEQAERALYGGAVLSKETAEQLQEVSLRWIGLLNGPQNRHHSSIDELSNNE